MAERRSKIAWVTGAGTGIGAALALRLVREGWHVAISGRRKDALDAVVAHEAAVIQGQAGIASGTGRLVAVPCDITRRQSIADCLDHITRILGPIDLAVLNAGTHDPITAAQFDAARVEALLSTNLLGTVNCLDPVLKQMLARRRGHIAIVSSVAGFRGLPTSGAYGASKAGLINMAEALQPELKRAGIKLQVVCPGFVKTPLTDKNDFPMPFVVSAEKAAGSFYRGLMSDKFEIVFPWQMGLLMKWLRLVPARMALGVTKNLIPK